MRRGAASTDPTPGLDDDLQQLLLGGLPATPRTGIAARRRGQRPDGLQGSAVVARQPGDQARLAAPAVREQALQRLQTTVAVVR